MRRNETVSLIQISHSNYSVRTKPQLSAVEPSTQCTSARGGSHRNATFGISHIENCLYNLLILLRYIEIQVRLLSSSRPILSAVLVFVHCYLIFACYISSNVVMRPFSFNECRNYRPAYFNFARWHTGRS